MRNIAIVSASAIALMVSVPALAQQPTSQRGAVPNVAGAQAQGTDRSQIKDKLGNINVEDRKEFKGRLVRAQSPEGHPVVMVIGPENMEGDKSLDNFNRDKVRGQLTQAGFQKIEFIEEPQAVRGKLDDKAILAMSAERGWRGEAGPAQAGSPNLDRLREQLGKIGLEDREEFRGRLVQASSGGQTLFVLVGPEDFESGESVTFTAGELSKFQQRGFQNARVVEDVRIVQGTLDDMAVIALTGRGITESGVGATGATGTTGSTRTPAAGGGSR
ncbi:MAG: hypothetical protein Q8M31_21150 [Beijerinckiaceae bacterium]|nr:hypothetical protein [Beijerinckiaceae bacterium]